MAFVTRIQNIKAFFMLSYIILFLLDSFFHLKLWTMLLIPVIIILFVLSFPQVKSFNKYLSILLMISGGYLLIKSSAPPSVWVDALVKNAGLTVLLLAVPMLSIIFYLEDFSSHISNFARKHINSNFSFYILTFYVINFFGMILNVASFSMVDKLLEGISSKYPEKLYHKALTRGFCLGQLWAPNFVAIAISLQYAGLQWQDYAVYGMLLSAVGTALCIGIAKITVKSYKGGPLGETASEEDEESGSDLKGLMKVTGIAVFLILFIISFQYLSGKSILVVVPFASVIFPLFLALLLRKKGTYKENFKIYFKTTLPKMNNEIILFTSVGLFGHALTASGVDKYIPLVIKSTGISNPAVLIPFIILFIFILSTIGFHPILTISAISIAYYAGAIPISQVQMGAVFSIGYFSYTLLSPFSGMVLAVASVTRKSPLDVGLRINLVFNLLLISISSVIIPMM